MQLLQMQLWPILYRFRLTWDSVSAGCCLALLVVSGPEVFGNGDTGGQTTMGHPLPNHQQLHYYQSHPLREGFFFTERCRHDLFLRLCPNGGFERTGRLTLAGLVKTPVENGSYRRSWTPVHRQAAFPLTASVKPIRRQVSVGRDAVLDRSKPRCSLENLDHDPSLWFSERLATPSYCLTLSVLLLAFKKRQHRLLLNLLDSIESKGSSRQHCNHLMLFKYSFFSEYIFVTFSWHLSLLLTQFWCIRTSHWKKCKKCK